MSIQRSPKYVARDIARQVLPKQQPRRSKPNKDGFGPRVKSLIVARSGGVCELDGCGRAEVIHHRGPRALGGTHQGWVNWAANGFHIASRCHDRIESHRTRAYVNGWLVSRLGSVVAADVPVLRRGAWVLLDDEGGVREIGGAA
ncbi:hypothetical protein [Nocardia wallacei]|uniref:hypothetical protein n=1 Tax=Nocardia wallacei TaxID=480035 RepID=UPI002454E511|nr:hypothetical protein [Nocardia wallacei]